MALRATTGPTLSTSSLRAGQPLGVTAKVENTGSERAQVRIAVEGLHEGALRSPVTHPFPFVPESADVPGKSRRSLAFSWTATLPEGKDAYTFRGRIVLRRVPDGALVGEAPLDVYVSR